MYKDEIKVLKKKQDLMQAIGYLQLDLVIN